MTKTWTGGNSREAAIGEDRNVFSNGGIPQSRSHLIGFWHAGSQWAQARENQNVSFLHPVVPCGLEGGDGGFLGDEDPGWALVEEDPFFIQKFRSNSSTLDHGTIGNEVALNKGHGTGKGFAGSLDHISGVNSVQSHELLLVDLASLGLFPPFQIFTQSSSRDGRGFKFQEVVIPEVEHHLGNSTSEENLYGRVAVRAIWQGVYQSGDLLVDMLPVFYGGPGQFRSMSDGGDMQDQVGRSSERRMKDHGVMERGFRENGREWSLVSGKVQEGEG